MAAARLEEVLPPTEAPARREVEIPLRVAARPLPLVAALRLGVLALRVVVVLRVVAVLLRVVVVALRLLREALLTLREEELGVLLLLTELLLPRLLLTELPLPRLLLTAPPLLDEEPALRLTLAPPPRLPPPLRCAATGTAAISIAANIRVITFEVFIRLLLSCLMVFVSSAKLHLFSQEFSPTTTYFSAIRSAFPPYLLQTDTPANHLNHSYTLHLCHVTARQTPSKQGIGRVNSVHIIFQAAPVLVNSMRRCCR